MTVGVDVRCAKTLVFLISAPMVGLAGGLFYIDNVTITPPDAFHIRWSAFIVFVVVAGGMGSLAGPIVGAVIYVIVDRLVAGYLGTGELALGVFAVLIILLLPRGVMGVVTDLRARRSDGGRGGSRLSSFVRGWSSGAPIYGLPSCRGLPARPRQVVIRLQPQPELGVAPADPLQCERHLGRYAGMSMQQPGERDTCHPESARRLDDSPSGITKAVLQALSRMWRIRHSPHRLILPSDGRSSPRLPQLRFRSGRRFASSRTPVRSTGPPAGPRADAPEARHVQVVRRAGGLQNAEYVPDARHQLRRQPGATLVFEQLRGTGQRRSRHRLAPAPHRPRRRCGVPWTSRTRDGGTRAGFDRDLIQGLHPGVPKTGCGRKSSDKQRVVFNEEI